MTPSSYPLVSVRIPAYNHERYIGACLDSVLNEPYPNKELVIINDGSQDNSDSLIRHWIDLHRHELVIKYVSRENRGLTATLNELVSLCEGDYLVSLASDDMLIAGGIGARVDYLENHCDKYAVIGDCKVVDEAGSLLFESGLTGMHSANIDHYLTDDGLKREIIWNWSVPGPVLLVRRAVYEKVGLYDTRTDVEDWDFYLRLVAKNLLGFVPCVVAAYRVHADNKSRKSNEVLIRRALLRAGMRNLGRMKGRYRRLLLKKIAVYTSQIFSDYLRRRSP